MLSQFNINWAMIFIYLIPFFTVKPLKMASRLLLETMMHLKEEIEMCDLCDKEDVGE